jgi:hypothetical protein
MSNDDDRRTKPLRESNRLHPVCGSGDTKAVHAEKFCVHVPRVVMVIREHDER